MSTNYWLTTHYPHPGDQSVDWNIYLQREKRSPSREPLPGDRVLFFELQSAKQVVGASRIPKGERRIVALATVVGPFQERSPDRAVVRYADGSIVDWAWEAPCADHNFIGRVEYQDVNRILGLPDQATMFGFGSGSGLGLLGESQFQELSSIFQSHRRE